MLHGDVDPAPAAWGAFQVQVDSKIGAIRVGRASQNCFLVFSVHCCVCCLKKKTEAQRPRIMVLLRSLPFSSKLTESRNRSCIFLNGLCAPRSTVFFMRIRAANRYLSLPPSSPRPLPSAQTRSRMGQKRKMASIFESTVIVGPADRKRTFWRTKKRRVHPWQPAALCKGWALTKLRLRKTVFFVFSVICCVCCVPRKHKNQRAAAMNWGTSSPPSEQK